MIFTSSDLIPLKQALLSGAKSVSIGDRTIQFQDLNELKKLISEIEASIAAQESSTIINPKIIKATFSKG